MVVVCVNLASLEQNARIIAQKDTMDRAALTCVLVIQSDPLVVTALLGYVSVEQAGKEDHATFRVAKHSGESIAKITANVSMDRVTEPPVFVPAMQVYSPASCVTNLAKQVSLESGVNTAVLVNKDHVMR